MKQKVFSIIVPVYNVALYLKRCVDSIINQTFTDMEIILVDDGSLDDSGKICDGYAETDSRIRVIHKKNGGLSEARNYGLDKANAEYTIFIDSDDFWEDNNFLERMYLYTEAKPDLIMFRFKRCNENGERIWSSYQQLKEAYVNSLSCEDKLLYLVKKDVFIVSACSKVIKTGFLKRNHLYFNKNLLGEDIDWCLNLVSKAANFIYSNENAYIYRVRDKSITKTISIKNCMDLYQTIDKWSAFYKKEANLKKQKAMLGFLAYEYYILLGMASSLNLAGDMELERLEFLVSYPFSRKTKICFLLYKVLGKQNAARIYAGVMKHK